jgi:tripartite-type tricarboxylate transporter receptor subunit TctC
MQRRTLVTAVTLALLGTTTGATWAQGAYPTKPVRLVVPFAPGGTTDIIARTLAEKLNGTLGQTVIVENKAGGGGIIGAAEIARSPADGYTLGVATVSTTASNPAINPKIGYNPLTDFTQITNVAATPNVLAVHPSFGPRDYKSFIAELKKNPGKHSYATSGTGGIGHLQFELYKSLTNTFVTHIPYRGAGPALNDVVAGQVPIMFDNLPSASEFIRAGTLRGIAVTTKERAPSFPDMPTIAEGGLAGYETYTWNALFAPPKTPKEVIDRLNAEALKAVKDPAVQERLKTFSATVVGSTPEALGEHVKTELAKWTPVVKEAGVQID